MGEDCVDMLESELATLQQMVDTQTTMLSTIQQQLSLLVNLNVHDPPQPTTATPSQQLTCHWSSHYCQDQQHNPPEAEPHSNLQHPASLMAPIIKAVLS
jgi:hypothetical protein